MRLDVQRSSVNRSPSVQLLPFGPSRSANSRAASAAARAHKSQRVRNARGVQGFLFAQHDHRRRMRNFPLCAGNDVDINKLPEIDVKKVFQGHGGAAYRVHDATVSLASSHRHRFRIYGYSKTTCDVNQALLRIAPHLPWRGELAVFRLGEIVPYLASPVISSVIVNKAIRMYRVSLPLSPTLMNLQVYGLSGYIH
ncbi:hypothetical protein PC9H_002873 [Pleurotus ostreatus]|uniref:Uncharacterized protein n=1 Tax=Pleurotus ostreatus TaxID=5322 RepID=A0A8H6ZTF5_PLEOS|nr:uncharacterized protein PC9H_008855 [Pleurotus ostreatus]XP_036633946.1 uncharacterized protein PC9H_002873 [Pleurotus ostreatus]KAF7426486.1 hypothetical protein PC9H_008855 [Pleurotus ostreatus]KAF7436047.1 hypothetical protein PC9H_002873 [Pleurotus ostreatus]